MAKIGDPAILNTFTVSTDSVQKFVPYRFKYNNHHFVLTIVDRFEV